MNISTVINDQSLNNARIVLNHIKNDIESMPILIFGCGNLGNKIGQFLLDKKLSVAAYCDNNSSKWGNQLNGIPILSPSDAAEKYGSTAVFIVCIWSPERSYMQFKQQLIELRVANIIHASAIMLTYPHELLPYYHFQKPEYYFAHKQELERVYNLLEDEVSKRQYLAHVDCRFNLNFEGLPIPDTMNQYFPADVITLSDKEVFLDAGAYNGDTLKDFDKRTIGKYSKFIALEPDPENFIKLNEEIATLNINHAISFPYAVGNDNCTLSFDATGGGQAVISEKGAIEVTCVKIDDKFFDAAPTFMKFDIEGAEMDALLGADKTIQTHKPVLAVCIYHLPSDLWTIPLYLKEKYPFYTFKVRTHQFDGLDFVLYALPKQ